MQIVRVGVISACSLCLLVPAAMGIGQIEMGSEEGLETQPVTTEGEDITTEEEFNPTITCTVGPGDDIYDLIDCLVDEISTPPPCRDVTADSSGSGGPVNLSQNPPDPDDCIDVHDRSDFYVYPLPYPQFGVEVVRVDGLPMERLMFRENDPGIQTTQVYVENVDRIGRIGEITEDATLTAELYVLVNDAKVIVHTFPGQTSVEITARIIEDLRDAGFLVFYVAPYIYVATSVEMTQNGITRIQMRSTDPGLASSDLGLLQPDDPLLPVGLAIRDPEPPRALVLPE